MSQQQQQQQQKYIFPVLKTAEIIACLDNIDIRLAENEIIKPTPVSALRLLDILAELFVGFKFGQFEGIYEDQETLNQALEEIMDYPELHRDSLPLMAFYRRLANFMTAIGLHDFGLQDLLKPQPYRMRAMISAIINFAKFREERLATFEQLSRQSEEYSVMREELIRNNQELLERINTIKLQRSEEQPAVDQLKQITHNLAAELKELKNCGDALNEDVGKAKQEKTDLQENLQNLSTILTHAKQDTLRLRSRIVRNPEQLKQSLIDMNKSLTSMKDSLQSSERSARELQMKAENLDLVEQDLISCIHLLDECETERRKMEETSQKLSNQTEGIERKQNEYRELSIKEQQLKRQEIASEERLARLHHQVSVKTSALDEKLYKLRQEWETVGADRTSVQDQVDKLDSEITDTKQKFQRLKSQHETEMTGIQTDFAKLKQQVISYMAAMRQQMAVGDLN